MVAVIFLSSLVPLPPRDNRKDITTRQIVSNMKVGVHPKAVVGSSRTAFIQRAGGLPVALSTFDMGYGG